MGTIDLRGKKPVRKPVPRAHAERKPQLKARRRKLRTIALVILVVVIGLCAYAVHWVSYLPDYQVRTIIVSGESGIRPQLVQALVETQLETGERSFLSPRNVLVADRDAIARSVVALLPRVASADVSSDAMLATAVQVTLHERVRYGYWCTRERECYAVDSDGFVFQKEATLGSSSSTPVFYGGIATGTPPIGQRFAGGKMSNVRALMDALTRVGFDVPGATVEDMTVVVPLREFSVRALLTQNPADIAKDLVLILGSDALKAKTGELEYIDLRFGNRVFYKFKNQTGEVGV